MLTIPQEKHNHRPVVIISGWFSVVNRWSDVLKIISVDTTVAYIETRDKISSIIEKSKKTDMSVARMAQDLLEIKDELGVDFSNSICIGSSMGAAILLQYLINQNQSPWKSLLIGPIAKFMFPPVIGSFLLMLPTFMVGFVMRYVRWHLLKFRVDREEEPKQAEGYDLSLSLADPWKIRFSGKAAKKFDIWDNLDQINANMILIGASADKLHASEITQKIGANLRNSEYIDFITNHATHSTEMADFLIKLSKN